MTIEDVSVSRTDKTVALIDVDLGRQLVDKRVVAFIKMRFSAKADDDKVQQLRKGQHARLLGLLKEFSVVKSQYLGVEPTKWANFTDTVIEESAR